MGWLRILAVTALTAGLAFFAGCSAPAVKTEMNPIITPHRANITMARIGIFSFRTPFQDPMLGSQMAHQFHQLLLARRAAWVVEVIPESYRDINEAIERARVLGYDVAVLGQLQEAFWGGSVEPSKATVDIRVVDTVRRVTVWYLSSSAKANPRRDKDLILFRTSGARARTPMELVGRLLAQMSDKLVHETNRPAKTTRRQSQEAQTRKEQVPQTPAQAPEMNPNYRIKETDLGSKPFKPVSGPLDISPKPSS